MRERLFELIVAEIPVDIPVDCLPDVDAIVDHLLGAGVIVPPVELGSRHKIYYPVKGTNVVHETKVYGIGVDEDGDVVIKPTE